jgi:hypothetical protein
VWLVRMLDDMLSARMHSAPAAGGVYPVHPIGPLGAFYCRDVLHRLALLPSVLTLVQLLVHLISTV